MDFCSEGLLPDQFDSLLENNFNLSEEKNDFIEQIEKELDPNMMNSLMFNEKSNQKQYPVIGDDLTREILSVFVKKEAEVLDASRSTLIECTHCDEIFSNEIFEMHVCKYDEQKNLIEECVQEQNETEMNKIRRHLADIMNKNRKMIHNILHGNTTAGQSSMSAGRAKQSNYECFVCNRKFVHESGLYRHYDKHIGSILQQSEPSSALHSAILCVPCNEVFTMDEKAWNHLREVHLEVECNDIFHNHSYDEFKNGLNNSGDKDLSGTLSNNQESTPKKNSSQDQPTNQPEAPKSPIQDVLRMIYVSRLYHCEFCDSVFVNEQSCLYHVSQHEPSEFFNCRTCDLKRLSLKDILIHRHEECWNYRDFRDTMKNIPNVFTCNVCEEAFYGIEQLVLHRHKEFHFFPRVEHRTSQLMLACEICMTIFENAPNLVRHLQETHLKKIRTPTVPETSTRVQKSPSNLRRGGFHQTSNKFRQYLCEFCGKSYTQSSHLWQHIRFHQGVKPFVCPHEECARRFTIRPDLNDHIRKCHTGERPYLCTICGKRFLTGSVYYQHRLIHKGERRYGCEDCGKRFYRADALKNHQRIHTDERPFVCWVPTCKKSFRQRGDRDKHVRARHKDAAPNSSPPKRQKVMSFGRGRTKNNCSLYNSRPVEGTSTIPI